jgi:hypothetical protein
MTCCKIFFLLHTSCTFILVRYILLFFVCSTLDAASGVARLEARAFDLEAGRLTFGDQAETPLALNGLGDVRVFPLYVAHKDNNIVAIIGFM